MSLFVYSQVYVTQTHCWACVKTRVYRLDNQIPQRSWGFCFPTGTFGSVWVPASFHVEGGLSYCKRKLAPNMKLTSHFHMLLRLKMHGAIPPLPCGTS
jgi:hypothetical protein